MRAWIVSDIHFSMLDLIRGRNLRVPDADVCICAGDIADNIVMGIAYIRRNIEPFMPVIVVLGNHDFFDSSIDLALETARVEIEDSRISLLENGYLSVGDCRFIGATLWTDFAVEVGGDEHIPPEERRALAASLLPNYMADYHRIIRSNERADGEGGKVTVHELLARHLESRAYIDDQLAIPFAGRTVVITHHAPLPESFDARFHGQITNAAFASDLSDLIFRRQPTVWIHGHIHKFRDYMQDRTRIICNPLGYASDANFSGFRAGFVVDL
ncbi:MULTISPECIES: metallophosphoesterase family protein [Rhizobium]|uniref:metallophosphoesterase family protein n=1 Tax=Rhizobium TaxID=379 RepID=UPI00102F4C5F|nr:MULTISPECIES: metallophosphoesterase family protein [Rhizobium]TAX51865.1 phosphohydrolase [Rhizobium leguminosarum]TBB35999.1 phosphohydrolase [Rhizobium ruizarguesonis]TCB17945.1 phosphohydrolase [Rhizobium leguminosarum bv. viciae]